MYTQEQKKELLIILGGEDCTFYEIKVFKPLFIHKTEIVDMVEGTYGNSMFEDHKLSVYCKDSEEYYLEVGAMKKKSMLNSLIQKAPLDQVPLYVNSIPEIVRWRLRIGV